MCCLLCWSSLCILRPMFAPVSLDCPFLIVPTVFPNAYIHLSVLAMT
jgi:hypothetical protein